MPYTPNSVPLYVAAFSGACAGMGVSEREPIFFVSQARVAEVAGAWAQALDTAWGATPVDTLVQGLAEQASYGVWAERGLPLASAAPWTDVVLGIVAVIVASQTYFAAQGITPPPIPSGGGNGNEAALVQTFTFSSASPILLGAVPAGARVTRADFLLTTPFDDGAAFAEFGLVGGSPSAFFGPTDALWTAAGQYERLNVDTVGAPDMLKLTLSPGASTQGAGLLFWEMSPV